MNPRVLGIMLLILGAAACETPTVGWGRPPSAPSQLTFTASPIGSYLMTFTASPSCSLPADAEQRSYNAEVFELTPGTVEVQVDMEVTCWGCTTGFGGTRDNDALHFTIKGNDGEIFEQYMFVDYLDEFRQLFYEGTADATLSATDITGGPFNGRFVLQSRTNGEELASCEAADHRLDFVAVR